MVHCLLYVSSIALPFNGQMVREAQAAEPTTPTSPAPARGAASSASGCSGPGTAPAQPGGAPSRPERTLLPPPAVASGDGFNFNRADLVEIIHILAQHLRVLTLSILR
jgi:hypothetical protein